jgi:anti-sigma factor RsiW
MNTAHPVAPEEVMAFLDGELSGAEAQAVSAHLDHCAECTTLSQQFRGTSQALAAGTCPLYRPSWSKLFEICPTKLA